ncbi:rod shape-determining protein MreD [Spirochaetia bacterium]|nr:rod shape-determining protein MreD [Spirochaetia bacterium]GHV21761.1 rod shape-determining protein MreD [Spirochaetia bacterium]
MTKNIIWASVFILIATILQSTLLSRLLFGFYSIPDIALCILVYSAYINGTMTGQMTGFFSGILIDFISAAPLGLNILTRTIIGAASGVLKGAFFVDTVFVPIALCGGATLFKALLLFLLHLLFVDAVPCYSISSPVLWVELLMNTVTAPFLFALLKMFNNLLKR